MLMKARPANKAFEDLALALLFEHVYVDVKVYPDEQFVQFVADEQIAQFDEQAVQLTTFVRKFVHYVQNPVAL